MILEVVPEFQAGIRGRGSPQGITDLREGEACSEHHKLRVRILQVSQLVHHYLGLLYPVEHLVQGIATTTAAR